MDQLNVVEFDITSICNSMCPQCARVQYDRNKDILATNARLPKKSFIDIEMFKKVLHSPRFSDTGEIKIIGAYSDPVTHPQFLEIIDMLTTVMKPDQFLVINTNGGLRTPEYFKKLGELMARQRRNLFTFSIDGLADTNKLYRWGVDFNKVMANLTAAASTDAKVQWKCIEFPWMLHQKPEIERIAEELGVELEYMEPRPCEDDFVVAEYIAVKEDRVTKASSTYVPSLPPEADVYWTKYMNFDYINPRCINEKSAFVGFDNRVYACCGQFTAMYDEMHEIMLEHMDWDSGWNDLTKHSFDEILRHPFWEALEPTISTKPTRYCQGECGECYS